MLASGDPTTVQYCTQAEEYQSNIAPMLKLPLYLVMLATEYNNQREGVKPMFQNIE
jgi:hypothetical protein